MSQILPDGMTIPQFFENYWDKGKAMVITGRGEKFVKDLISELHDLNLQSLLAITPSPTTFVWLPKENGVIDQVKVKDPTAAEKMYNMGGSILFDGPEEL